MDEHSFRRISQDFRSTKPIVDRKRPRENLNSTDQFRRRDARRIDYLAETSSFNRPPLREIAVNTPYSCFKTDFKSPNSISCITKLSSPRAAPYSGVSEASSTRIPVKYEYTAESYITPVKLSDCFSLSDSLSERSLLDDEFDESILAEIDAICEQQSAAKVDCQSPNITSTISHDVEAGAEYVIPEENKKMRRLDSGGDFVSKEEHVDTSLVQFSESMPAEYSKYLLSLNDRQREAACSDISIPLMIAAGPGSGKTSTMVGRVLMLLNEGIHPSNILAMTFTKAAASEMRDRVGSVAGKATAKELTMSTFHSFSLQLCRSHSDKLERTPEFLIYGHGQQRRAIIEAVRLYENEKNGGSSETVCPQQFKDKAKKWLKYVTQAKASGKTPGYSDKTANDTGDAILKNYYEILKSCNALDYHDLINCSVRLLSEFPEVLKECQDTWKAIIIDEFQDTSSMQYTFLRLLASHKRITIVGDDDQSIFGFNGADTSGFSSFRKDFPNYKEIRLVKNYRSTGCIVEAANAIIQQNMNRSQSKTVMSENSHGAKISIKECQNENAQCAYVVDKILESTSGGSTLNCSYGNIAVLYRRQVSGKVFQAAFRDRKVPFNVHGVALYRKKVVGAIIAMLKTSLAECDDGAYRRVFKALLPFEKDEKKRVIEYIDKISIIRKSSFISAACDIFRAKISGTFKRNQLTQGRKVLSTIEMISKLVLREESLSAVVTSVANMVPQRYLLEQRAVIDVDGGKFLNEDNDLRSVLQCLLDDISNFLSMHFTSTEEKEDAVKKHGGCVEVLKAFLDYVSERESENFRSRRRDNENSITLTTIHQSKGLEWDIVFIVKANETEIPLLHEFNGVINGNEASLEEERRLLYVAMTRARKKLFILYLTLDSNWQVLQPSRFLKEIPGHLRDDQAEIHIQGLQKKCLDIRKETAQLISDIPKDNQPTELTINAANVKSDGAPTELAEMLFTSNGNSFLKRFSVEDRSVVSHLFNQWAKKQAFQQPKRLLEKVRFVIDERLTIKKNKHKDVLRSLKSYLSSDEAFQYAEYVLRWEKIPADQRAHIMREKQEHFQKLRIENSMGSSAPTSKQIAYLQSLGCTVSPTSCLHASRLIEQYKSL